MHQTLTVFLTLDIDFRCSISMLPLPPTSRLPPMREIRSCTFNDLSEALTYLRHIYNPEVRGSRRRPRTNPTDSHIHPSHTNSCLDLVDSGLGDLRGDVFERGYAIKWLTHLVAQTSLQGTVTDMLLPREWEVLIQDAAALLAIFSGTAGAGVIIRDFVFTTASSEKIKVHIRDVPLDNTDYGSVGAQTWGGACILAEMIVENPAKFGLLSPHAKNELRILELGAGTGLVSLTVGKLFSALSDAASSYPHRTTTIIATDYYPSILDNLDHNIHANFQASSDSHRNPVRISSHFLDWSQCFDASDSIPLVSAPFDLVLGADIVYEAQHARWIKSCLTRLLRTPSPTDNSGTSPVFHLVIPLRSTHTSESQTVETVFSAQTSQEGLQLRIISTENIVCDAENGSHLDQVQYAYYRIAWS